MAESKIDILQQRIELYELQRKRVELDLKIEQSLKKTFPSLNQDLRLLREMLSDVEEIQNRKQQHGKFPDF